MKLSWQDYPIEPLFFPLDEREVTWGGSFDDHITTGGTRETYAGVDYKALTPLPYYAVTDGYVINYIASDGCYVSQLNVDDNLYFEYVHGSEFSWHNRVQAGQQVGITGKSGAEAPHLHFGAVFKGKRFDYDYYYQTYLDSKLSIKKNYMKMSEEILFKGVYVLTWIDKENQVHVDWSLNGQNLQSKNPDHWVQGGAIYLMDSFIQKNDQNEETQLVQKCLGTDGNLYIRVSDNGMSWTPWQKFIFE